MAPMDEGKPSLSGFILLNFCVQAALTSGLAYLHLKGNLHSLEYVLIAFVQGACFAVGSTIGVATFFKVPRRWAGCVWRNRLVLLAADLLSAPGAFLCIGWIVDQFRD